MATSEVEPQEDLPSRSEWNGLESTEHMDFNNTTSTADITTASTIMTTTTSNSSRIPALNPTTADSDSDCDSATIRAGATTTAAIITNNTSSTPNTTITASTTAATTTDFTTNSTTATTISTSDLTSTDPTTTSSTCDLTTDTTTSDTTSTSTTTISSCGLTATTTTTSTTTTTLTADADQTDEEQPDELYIENATSAASDHTAGSEDHVVTSTPTHLRPAPPITLALSGSRPRKKKMLVAPALSLSLGQSDSALSEDFPSAFLSPSPDQEDDTKLDLILDAMETPSDSESLHFPSYDLDLEDEFRRLGVSSHQQRSGSSPRPRRRSRGFVSEESASSGLGCLDREDSEDSEGTRWRTFSTGQPGAGPPQEGRVNMSVVEPYLRVLSHGGYYGDGMNDIIVFSSCYLPENSLNNYDYVMDNLFRYAVGTLDLMVAENYVIVYLCAGAQKERLPGISWLRECYTTIHRRLRKNLKGLYVVHPTWFIKAMITIIKPFISSKFSRKLQFVDSLQELSQLIPTEHVQIPDSVRQFDENLNR